MKTRPNIIMALLLFLIVAASGCGTGEGESYTEPEPPPTASPSMEDSSEVVSLTTTQRAAVANAERECREIEGSDELCDGLKNVVEEGEFEPEPFFNLAREFVGLAGRFVDLAVRFLDIAEQAVDEGSIDLAFKALEGAADAVKGARESNENAGRPSSPSTQSSCVGRLFGERYYGPTEVSPPSHPPVRTDVSVTYSGGEYRIDFSRYAFSDRVRDLFDNLIPGYKGRRRGSYDSVNRVYPEDAAQIRFTRSDCRVYFPNPHDQNRLLRATWSKDGDTLVLARGDRGPLPIYQNPDDFYDGAWIDISLFAIGLQGFMRVPFEDLDNPVPECECERPN